MMHNDNALPDLLHFSNRLRATRESRKLSLEDISNRLRVKPDVIHHIESGDFKSAHPPIFMRGYLRSYARMMDFSDSDVQAALAASGLVINPDSPLAPNLQKFPTDRSGSISRLHWISMGILLTLVFIVFVWWNAYPVTLVREHISAHMLPPTAQTSPSTQSPEVSEVGADNNLVVGTTPTEASDTPLILQNRFNFMPDTSDVELEPAT